MQLKEGGFILVRGLRVRLTGQGRSGVDKPVAVSADV